MNVISYSRFSSGTQAKGSSLHRQQAMIDDWLQRHPDATYHEAMSFADLGISGWSGKHLEAGFGQLLEAVDAGRLGEGWYCLVEDLSRVSRLDPMDAIAQLNRLTGSGLTLVTLADGAEYSRQSIRENAGLIYSLVGQLQASWQYSDTLSRRIKASYTKRREQAAAGLTVRRRTPFWLTSEGELLPEQAAAVRGLYERYTQGDGERMLMRWLETELSPCPVKEPSSIKRILKNPVARGMWEGHRIYPPAVPDDLWYAVQQAIEVRAPKHIAKARTWLLSGLVKCGSCGTGCTVNKSKGKLPLLKCGLRSRKGPEHCPNNRTIPYHLLSVICAMHEREAVEATEDAGDTGAELAKANERIETLVSKQETLIDTLLEVPSDAIRARLKVVEAELGQHKAEAARLLQTAPAHRLIRWEDIEAGDIDVMGHNRALQAAGFTILIFPDGSIECRGHLYRYDGFSRSTGVYRLVDEHGEAVAQDELVLTKAAIMDEWEIETK